MSAGHNLHGTAGLCALVSAARRAVTTLGVFLMVAAVTGKGAIACQHYGMVPKTMDGNLAFRERLLTMASANPSDAAQIYSMCAEDPLFYINAFCWTYAPKLYPKTPVMPFITYAFQDEAILTIADCIDSGRDFAMPKSRDMGASWMGLSVFEWFWHFRDYQTFLLVSRNEDYVDKRGNPKSLFWKIDFIHQYQPNWLLPEGRWLGFKDPNRKILHLANAVTGSVIDGESTTGDVARGDRRTAIFIDEYAAFGLDDGFRVLKSTRDATDCRGFNSTPQGANNAFYEVVHNTAAEIVRLHWSEHPEKSRGLYTTDERTGQVVLLDDFRGPVEVRRKEFKGKKLLQYPDEYPFELDQDDPKLRSPWYDNECARCASPQEVAQELDIDFLGSDYPFFDPKFIEILRKRYCKTPVAVGDIEFDRDTLEPKRFVENAKGQVVLWLPLDGAGRIAKDRAFVMGSDVSAGTGASNSVSCVVDRGTGEKVAVFKTPHLRPNPFAERSIAMGRFFNKAFMVWDASGPTGKVFTQRVIQAGYGDIYYRRNEKKVTRQISDEPGYYLNPQAREALLEDYRSALADRRFINRSASGMAECLQFIRKPDGTIEHSAAANAQDPSGARTAHGDEVIADALACLGLHERQEKVEAEKPALPVGSLAWRIQQKKDAMTIAADTLGEGW